MVASCIWTEAVNTNLPINATLPSPMSNEWYRLPASLFKIALSWCEYHPQTRMGRNGFNGRSLHTGLDGVNRIADNKACD